jgi:hypothetical protein
LPRGVTLADGSPLPSWLAYHKGSKAFTASNVPEGFRPVKVVIQVGDKSWVVAISPSQSNEVALQ